MNDSSDDCGPAQLGPPPVRMRARKRPATNKLQSGRAHRSGAPHGPVHSRAGAGPAAWFRLAAPGPPARRRTRAAQTTIPHSGGHFRMRLRQLQAPARRAARIPAGHRSERGAPDAHVRPRSMQRRRPVSPRASSGWSEDAAPNRASATACPAPGSLITNRPGRSRRRYRLPVARTAWTNTGGDRTRKPQTAARRVRN